MGNSVSIIENYIDDPYGLDDLFCVTTSCGPIYMRLAEKNGKITLEMSSPVIDIEVYRMYVVGIIYIKMNVNSTEYNVYWYQNNSTIEVYHTKNANIICKKFLDPCKFIEYLNEI